MQMVPSLGLENDCQNHRYHQVVREFVLPVLYFVLILHHPTPQKKQKQKTSNHSHLLFGNFTTRITHAINIAAVANMHVAQNSPRCMLGEGWGFDHVHM